MWRWLKELNKRFDKALIERMDELRRRMEDYKDKPVPASTVVGFKKNLDKLTERVEKLEQKLEANKLTEHHYTNNEIEYVLNSWSNSDYKQNGFTESCCVGAELMMLQIIKQLFEEVKDLYEANLPNL